MKEQKQSLRRILQEKRRLLSPSLQKSYSEQICHRLLTQPFFEQAQHLALYLGFAGEVCTLPILEKALAMGKSCYLPLLAGEHLRFVKTNQHSCLTKNKFGILEPHWDPRDAIQPQALDLVLLPLVAFDKTCHRLGMGGGYYDKTFSFKKTSVPPPLVGLAYDFQCVEHVPHSDLDILLEAIITEKNTYQYLSSAT